MSTLEIIVEKRLETADKIKVSTVMKKGHDRLSQILWIKNVTSNSARKFEQDNKVYYKIKVRRAFLQEQGIIAALCVKPYTMFNKNKIKKLLITLDEILLVKIGRIKDFSPQVRKQIQELRDAIDTEYERTFEQYGIKKCETMLRKGIQLWSKEVLSQKSAPNKEPLKNVEKPKTKTTHR